MAKKKQIPQAKKSIEPQKTKNKIPGPQTIRIPETDIESTPQNILAMQLKTKFLKKENSNLILPTSYQKDERAPGGNANIKEKSLDRWICVKAGDNMAFDVEPGDELLIADNPQAIAYVAPMVLDQETGFTFAKFDQTEIHGIRKKKDLRNIKIEFYKPERMFAE